MKSIFSQGAEQPRYPALGIVKRAWTARSVRMFAGDYRSLTAPDVFHLFILTKIPGNTYIFHECRR
jgi:hypothetical protein